MFYFRLQRANVMDSSQIMVITAPETPKSGRATFHALCPAVSIATSSRKSLRRRHQSNNSQEKSRRQPRKSRRRLNGAQRRDCPLGVTPGLLSPVLLNTYETFHTCALFQARVALTPFLAPV